MRHLSKESGLLVKVILALCLIVTGSASAKEKNLNLVTTTTDLASIASYIAGDRAQVESLTDGNVELHYVSARPDFIRKVNQADLLVFVGLDMEIGWLPLVLRQSRNARVQRGAGGFVDASQGIQPLEIPTGEIDRGMGDVHPLGNPHYMLDPVRVVVVARNITDALIAVEPKSKEIFESNWQKFRGEAMSLLEELRQQFKPHQGRQLIAYHQEFSYLADRFGIVVAGHIEERPGVAPSPRHLRELAERFRSSPVKVVANVPWGNLSYSQRVANDLGAEHLVLPIQVGATEGTSDWFAMLRTSTDILVAAFQKAALQTE